MLNSVHDDAGMTPLNFCYWLRGFMEIAQPEKIKGWQIDIINEHLDLVMEPVTPTAKYTTSLQEALGKENFHDKALEQMQRWYPDKGVPFKGERIYGSC